MSQILLSLSTWPHARATVIFVIISLSGITLDIITLKNIRG